MGFLSKFTINQKTCASTAQSVVLPWGQFGVIYPAPLVSEQKKYKYIIISNNLTAQIFFLFFLIQYSYNNGVVLNKKIIIKKKKKTMGWGDLYLEYLYKKY